MSQPPLDHSQLSLYQACPEKFKLRYVDQLRRCDALSSDLPLLAGQIVHRGVELSQAKVAQVLILEGMQKVAMQDASRYDLLQQDKLYQFQNLLTAVKAYQEYALLNFAGWTVLETESLYTYLAGIFPLPYAVKRDAIWKNPEDIIYPIEIKTTQKALTESWWRTFESSSQVTGILDSVMEEHPNVGGCLLLTCQWGYRKTAYRGEPAGFHCQWSHQEFNRTQAQRTEWRQNIALWQKRLLQSRETGQWGRVRSLCAWCEYQPLCAVAGDPDAYDQVKDSLYVKDATVYDYLLEDVK